MTGGMSIYTKGISSRYSLLEVTLGNHSALHQYQNLRSCQMNIPWLLLLLQLLQFPSHGLGDRTLILDAQVLEQIPYDCAYTCFMNA